MYSFVWKRLFSLFLILGIVAPTVAFPRTKINCEEKLATIEREHRREKTERLAKIAGLKVFERTGKRYQRTPWGQGYRYFYERPNGERQYVTDPDELARIAAIGIPSNWTDVNIWANKKHYLMATGIDPSGKKQPLYHPDFKQTSADHKFDNITEFGEIVGKLRQQAIADLHDPTLSETRLLAGLVLILDHSAIRMGNDGSVRARGNFGLTTLRTGHVEAEGNWVYLDFKGKKGKQNYAHFENAKLARLIRRLEKLDPEPTDPLFRYEDENGDLKPIHPDRLNQYIRTVTGNGFSGRSFRTWWATVITAEELAAHPIPQNDRQKRKYIRNAVKVASEFLNNTPHIARKDYIHPKIIEAYTEDPEHFKSFFNRRGRPPTANASGLSKEELSVLRLLEQYY